MQCNRHVVLNSQLQPTGKSKLLIYSCLYVAHMLVYMVMGHLKEQRWAWGHETRREARKDEIRENDF